MWISLITQMQAAHTGCEQGEVKGQTSTESEKIKESKSRADRMQCRQYLRRSHLRNQRKISVNQ